MSGNISKIVKNKYVFSLISRAVIIIVGLLFTVFQARYLGADIKGQVATVNSIVKITSIVFGFGAYHAYPYFKKNTNVDILPIFMKISLLFLLIYLAISGAVIFFFDISLKYIMVLVLTPLLTYDGVVSYITLIEVPNKKNSTDIFVNCGELILILFLWKFAKPTFIIGVLVITIKDILKALVFTFWWRNRIFVKTEPILKVWLPKIVKFGFFPMLSLLMSTLNYRVDVIMLDGRVPDAAIGVYSIGVLIAERIWMIPEAMKGVMVHNLTRGKDAEEVEYVIRLCNTLCLFLIVGIIILGQPFINFVFGMQYSGAYQITLIMLFGAIAMNYYKVIASYNIAMGKQKISFIFLSISALLNIVINLFAIPLLGTVGAGIASVLSYTVCSILFIVYFCKTTQAKFFNMVIVNREDCAKLIEKLKT